MKPPYFCWLLLDRYSIQILFIITKLSPIFHDYHEYYHYYWIDIPMEIFPFLPSFNQHFRNASQALRLLAEERRERLSDRAEAQRRHKEWGKWGDFLGT
jgi:hypothetical protein